jgi:hypothetical protein
MGARFFAWINRRQIGEANSIASRAARQAWLFRATERHFLSTARSIRFSPLRTLWPVLTTSRQVPRQILLKARLLFCSGQLLQNLSGVDMLT